jgi:hypothetical protein
MAAPGTPQTSGLTNLGRVGSVGTRRGRGPDRERRRVRLAVENDAVAALLSLLSKRDRGWCISSPVRDEQRNKLEQMASLENRSVSNLIEVMADERWKRLAEQQGVAYAKTVAEAMDLKLDMDNPRDREKLRRAVLDLVAGRKMPKQKHS